MEKRKSSRSSEVNSMSCTQHLPHVIIFNRPKMMTFFFKAITTTHPIQLCCSRRVTYTSQTEKIFSAGYCFKEVSHIFWTNYCYCLLRYSLTACFHHKSINWVSSIDESK